MSDSELHVPAWVEPFIRNLRPELRAKLSLRDIDDLWRAASAATDPARIKDRQEWRAALRTAHEESKQLRARVAELEQTLSDERAIAVVDRAAREAFEADNARLRGRGREVLIHIMRARKASIGSIDSHCMQQFSVPKIHEIAQAFGIKP